MENKQEKTEYWKITFKDRMGGQEWTQTVTWEQALEISKRERAEIIGWNFIGE